MTGRERLNINPAKPNLNHEAEVRMIILFQLQD